MISPAPVQNPQTDQGGLPALAWTGWYNQVAGALGAFDQTGAIPNNTFLNFRAPGNKWNGTRVYQNAYNNFAIDTNRRTSQSGADSWTNALGIVPGLTSLNQSVQIAYPAQAYLDLWNTASGTPSGGAHWRVFADNVGGGGGNLTFGLYDIPNNRVAFGIDNNGAAALPFAVYFSQPENIRFGNGWLPFTANVTGGGSMTISGVANYNSAYLRVGPMVHVKIFVVATFGGAASNAFFVSLPIAPVDNYGCLSATIYTMGALFNQTQSASGTLAVYANNGATFPLTTFNICISGSYRCA